jgi:hypothetical protein
VLCLPHLPSPLLPSSLVIMGCALPKSSFLMALLQENCFECSLAGHQEAGEAGAVEGHCQRSLAGHGATSPPSPCPLEGRVGRRCRASASGAVPTQHVNKPEGRWAVLRRGTAITASLAGRGSALTRRWCSPTERAPPMQLGSAWGERVGQPLQRRHLAASLCMNK